MTTLQHRTTSFAATGHRAEVARVLGAAFLDDPVFAWIIPERSHLEAVIVPVFDAFVEAFARHDESWVAVGDGTVVGGALWAPPGADAVHPDDEPGLTAALVELSGPHLERMSTCLEQFGSVHPTEPAWYLNFLGVDPAHQGQGTGAALLREVLDRADAAGDAAYLEATNLRNRQLYERHGFRCTAEITLPDGPTAYAMWRDPQGAGPQG